MELIIYLSVMVCQFPQTSHFVELDFKFGTARFFTIELAESLSVH